jgi:predicted enzyme related to lactoylglutathione lyase
MQTAISAKGIDAHFYLSKDAPRAIAFYTALLGTTPARGNDQYAEFDLGDHSTFGISMAPPDGWQPAGGVMFAVDDVNGALAHAVELGATVALNEDGATCTTAWCFDLDGNTFALHHRKG